jgi:hypothetical protein
VNVALVDVGELEKFTDLAVTAPQALPGRVQVDSNPWLG